MQAQHIQPRLKLFDLSIIVISLIIGMGIFRTPSEVAAKAQSVNIFFLAWAAGALVSFVGALTFAEIGSRFPVAGGFYKIFSFCYHPAFAFMVNWITVLSNAAANAAVALMGAAYIAPILFPNNIDAPWYVALLMIVILMFINLAGIKSSSKLLNVLMLLKIGLMLTLISCVLFTPFHPINTAISTDDASPLSHFIMCFIPIFFTFGGYQQSINFGADVHQASRTIPRAVFIGISAVLLLYLAINYAYYHVLGLHNMASSQTLVADVFAISFSPAAAKIVSVAMFFAVLTFINVSFISNPRMYLAMAEDKVMPKLFLKINKKTQVQVWAVLFFALLMILSLFLIQTFSALLEYVMFFDSISLMSAAAAIFILRKRNTALQEQPYKMKLYPFLPIFFLLIYALVNVSVLLANPKAFGIGVILFLLAYPLFLIIKKINL